MSSLSVGGGVLFLMNFGCSLLEGLNLQLKVMCFPCVVAVTTLLPAGLWFVLVVLVQPACQG